MHPVRRTRLTIVVVLAALGLLAFAGPSAGQVLDDRSASTTTAPTTTASTLLPSSSTTTTTTAPATTTTAPPQSSSTTAPPPAAAEGEGDGGDGIEADGPIPRVVPPDAQRIINSVQRTPPNNTKALHAAVQELVELGLTEEEAIRIGFGRFPIAGVANYSHDWLFPRYGPGFRFHHGTDVFAPFGTPLRAAVDGIVTAKTSELGGLSVKITMPDGTYFYYAHLSSLPDDFVNGAEVVTGDIVGYVGDSGNAKGGSPHLHIGVYPQGGGPTDPKPILDGFIADAMDALPGIVEQVRAQRTASPESTEATGIRTPRSLLATSLLRPVTGRTAAGIVPTEVLYQASGNPSGGGVSVAESQADALAATIDWDAAAARSATEELLRARTMALVDLALGPFGRTGSTSAETAAVDD